jgi:tetratricopeptide (TPR) repeat protein
VEAIAQLCGYLPLALRLAGSVLAERRDLSPADYVRRLGQTQSRLKLVEASLSLSYELLDAQTQDLFDQLAIFPGTFDREAATRVWDIDPDVAQDGLSELVRYSVVEWDSNTARYHLHDLVRLYADAHLNEADRTAAQSRHALYYEIVLRATKELYMQSGETQKRALDTFDLEWRNIQAGQAWAAAHADSDPIATALCSAYPNAGTHLLMLRQPPRERLRWNEAALAAAQRLNDHQAEVGHLGGLGGAYVAIGEFRRAIEVQHQRLTLARRMSARKDEAYALGDIGQAYLALGEPHQAIEHFEAALVLDRDLGHRGHESNMLGGLGNACLALNTPDQAVTYQQHALAIEREMGHKRGESRALLGLGRAYSALGQPRRALSFYEQALTIARELGDARGEGGSHWHMSQALHQVGEDALAVMNAEVALKIFERIEHPHATQVREQLAKWQETQG